MQTTDAGAPTQQDRDFWFNASRYLLFIELLVQTSLFAMLMILQVNPAIIVAVCAVVLIACRIAARTCKRPTAKP